MNAANGFTQADDDLPERFFKNDSRKDGKIILRALSRTDFCLARTKYYYIRGLNEEGLPTEEKAEALELEWKV